MAERKIVKQDRPFKGVWIDAETWLDENLSITEIVLLTEIKSLENKQGCFASNAYFAEFFGLSKSRISQLVGQLKDKGYITIKYQRDGKKTTQRFIEAVKNPNSGIKNTKYPIKNSKYPIKNSVRGYLENCEGNNIINNTVNNTVTNTNKQKQASACPADAGLSDCFDKIWNLYPKKQGKKDAFRHYKAWRKKSKDNTDAYLLQQLDKYKAYLAANQWLHPMNGSTWFNGRFDDDYSTNSSQGYQPQSIDNQAYNGGFRRLTQAEKDALDEEDERMKKEYREKYGEELPF